MKTDKTDKMKIYNILRILNLRIARNYVPSRSAVYECVDTQTIIDAMDDCADQAISEYKRKLKLSIQMNFEWAHNEIGYEEIIHAIDTTTI